MADERKNISLSFSLTRLHPWLGSRHPFFYVITQTTMGYAKLRRFTLCTYWNFECAFSFLFIFHFVHTLPLLHSSVLFHSLHSYLVHNLTPYTRPLSPTFSFFFTKSSSQEIQVLKFASHYRILNDNQRCHRKATITVYSRSSTLSTSSH